MAERLQLREVAIRGKRGIDEKLCEAARRKREMDERLCEAAILGGNTATLSQLLQGDPSILGGDYERTDHPVHLGAMFGHADVLTEILNQEPALTRKLNSKGLSPLHMASERGHVEVVKAILSIDADVCFVRDNDGRIPLHLAAINGHVDVLRLLVEAKKITAWLLTNERDPLLHLCANHAQFDAVKTLVECVKEDTFVGLKNSKGDTILHVLSDMRQAEMIEVLLKNITIKLQINALNANELTALDVVEQKRWERDYWELKGYLVKGGAKTSKDLLKRQPSTLRWKLSEHDSNWLERKQDSILVVAVLIASVAFDTVRNPPGGLWQDSKDEHIAGESILSYTNHLSYLIFSFSNQVAFFASSSTILFMLFKARIPAKHLTWMSIVLMWIGIVSMWIAFVSTLYSIGTRAKKTKNFQNLTCIIFYALAVVAPVGIPRIMACFKSIQRIIGHCRGHGGGRNQIP